MVIDYIGIADQALRIKAYYHSIRKTMTPEAVCKLKDIELIEMDTRLSTKVYKANYTYSKRQHIILYNMKIRRYLDAVLYHEIGHRVLHWKSSDYVFHLDSDVFGVKSRFEVEANVFSAEMLMDDDTVLKCFFGNRMTFFQTAQCLNVPEELLYYKCNILQARGHRINIPISAAGSFMKGKDY